MSDCAPSRSKGGSAVQRRSICCGAPWQQRIPACMAGMHAFRIYWAWLRPLSCHLFKFTRQMIGQPPRWQAGIGQVQKNDLCISQCRHALAGINAQIVRRHGGRADGPPCPRGDRLHQDRAAVQFRWQARLLPGPGTVDSQVSGAEAMALLTCPPACMIYSGPPCLRRRVRAANHRHSEASTHHPAMKISWSGRSIP